MDPLAVYSENPSDCIVYTHRITPFVLGLCIRGILQPLSPLQESEASGVESITMAFLGSQELLSFLAR
jgi:hypothetical protein